MKYSCTECWYVYDESKWEPGDDIVAWTKIDELWDYFSCPGCWTDATAFISAKEEVNYPLHTEGLSAIEREHKILFEIHGNELSVRIWEPSHVMGSDHYISSISLMDEDGELIEERFLVPEDDAPELIFDLDYIENFEILCRCTQHGVWGSGKISLEK